MQAGITNAEIERIRRDFPYLEWVSYLDTAAISPVPLSIQKAMNEHTDLVVGNVRRSWDVCQSRYATGRDYAARLVGSRADRIAYVQNTSHGLSMVALGIDWRPGDNVVLPALEFPSNYLCWIQLAKLGVEIRLVEAINGKVPVESFAAKIDARTRVVAVSHVQFYSGFRVDVAELGDVCAASETLLVVDGTQSIGALELNVTAANVDVLCVSAHKWLAGPRGAGFMALSDKAFASVSPRIVGWLSVEEPFAFRRTLDFRQDGGRFESGTESGAALFGLVERLRQLVELGIGRIEARVRELTDDLDALCSSRGIIRVYDQAAHERSGISLLRVPGVASEDILRKLEESGIQASLRSESIRLSPHYYNTSAELERAVEIMAA